MKKYQNPIDFLGIGAQKSGTTWLYSNLKQIETFHLPPIKELHYFDRDTKYPSPDTLSESAICKRIYQKKTSLKPVRRIWWYVRQKKWHDVRFLIKWFLGYYSDEWYLSLFKSFEGYTGEITPSYSLLNVEDIEKINILLPDVKLVLMLRNPIDRAWSHYRFDMKGTNDFKFENIELDEILRFIESDMQTLRSDYIRTIDNYLQVFKKEQILVCFYDAILDNPQMLLDNILKHICGEITFSTSNLNLEEVVNKSPTVSCPKEVRDYLKNKYRYQIKELSDRYGGYFTKWYVDTYNTSDTYDMVTLTPTMYLG